MPDAFRDLHRRVRRHLYLDAVAGAGDEQLRQELHRRLFAHPIRLLPTVVGSHTRRNGVHTQHRRLAALERRKPHPLVGAGPCAADSRAGGGFHRGRQETAASAEVGPGLSDAPILTRATPDGEALVQSPGRRHCTSTARVGWVDRLHDPRPASRQPLANAFPWHLPHRDRRTVNGGLVVGAHLLMGDRSYLLGSTALQAWGLGQAQLPVKVGVPWNEYRTQPTDSIEVSRRRLVPPVRHPMGMPPTERAEYAVIDATQNSRSHRYVEQLVTEGVPATRGQT